ncbi:MAG: hypothetical protein MK132_17835, partial [Lentisphaerales bacterium]|nr:hypothetical protein [Lentisphaerales bacterium]
IQLREALSTTMPKPGESRRIECRSASSKRRRLRKINGITRSNIRTLLGLVLAKKKFVRLISSFKFC